MRALWAQPLVRLVAVAAVVVVVGLVTTEVAMAPPAGERRDIAVLYAAVAAVTLALYWVVGRAARRVSTFRAVLQLVAIASVVAAGAGVVLAARTMFLGDHDRDLVLLVLAVGVGLGSALAVAVGASMSRDVARLRAAADAVTAGDLDARTGVDRADELGAVADAFDRMVGRLRANEEERRLLIAGVGHDLRTPLAALRAVLEGVEDGVVAVDGDTAAAMARDVEHLSRLVDDLFLHARTQAGRWAPALEDVDLAELCDDAAEALAPLGRARDVTVVAATDGPVPVRGDPWALGRVLRNLLDNAVRHSPGGATVRVELRPGDDAGFAVLDEGPGFAPAFRSRAFDHFARDDDARRPSHGGAGLGLSIARAIVEAHGATIDVADGPGGRVEVTGLRRP